jgi:hypothetical protein
MPWAGAPGVQAAQQRKTLKPEGYEPFRLSKWYTNRNLKQARSTHWGCILSNVVLKVPSKVPSRFQVPSDL